MDRQLIKGEYFFDITIFTMFGLHNIKVGNHNIVLNNGISYFLNRWIGNDDDLVGKIAIGTGEGEVEPSQNSLFEPVKDSLGNQLYIIPDRIYIDDNKLILTCDTNGSMLNNTTEIGVCTSTNEILLSKDVHPIYEMPTTAIVKLDYIFTLISVDNSIDEDMEEWE